MRYIEFAVVFAIISVFGHNYHTVVLKGTIPAGAVIQATDIERRGFKGCTCTLDYSTDLRQVVGHRALKPISGEVHLSDVSQ